MMPKTKVWEDHHRRVVVDGDSVVVYGDDLKGTRFTQAEWVGIVGATKGIWGVQHYESLDALREHTKRMARED